MADRTENAYQKQESISVGGRACFPFQYRGLLRLTAATGMMCSVD